MSSLTAEVLAMLACPVCRKTFRLAESLVICTGCDRRYPVMDGIPVLIAERALQTK